MGTGGQCGVRSMSTRVGGGSATVTSCVKEFRMRRPPQCSERPREGSTGTPHDPGEVKVHVALSLNPPIVDVIGVS